MYMTTIPKKSGSSKVLAQDEEAYSNSLHLNITISTADDDTYAHLTNLMAMLKAKSLISDGSHYVGRKGILSLPTKLDATWTQKQQQDSFEV